MSGSELTVILVAALLLLGSKQTVKLAKVFTRQYRVLRRKWEELKREAGLDLDDIDSDIKDIKKKLK